MEELKALYKNLVLNFKTSSNKTKIMLVGLVIVIFIFFGIGIDAISTAINNIRFKKELQLEIDKRKEIKQDLENSQVNINRLTNENQEIKREIDRLNQELAASNARLYSIRDEKNKLGVKYNAEKKRLDSITNTDELEQFLREQLKDLGILKPSNTDK